MNLTYLVLAMAVVTYIPRMLPLVLLQNVCLPRYIKSFMGFIPYAALGALIFPGALHSTGAGNFESAIAGCIVSILLAWWEMNLIFVVVGGIAGAFIVNILLKI
ncbi:AzlD domain-containing protein [Pelosinus propionicus]|uniref:Branched-chain amino acid transport protein n=1 Tax=Pelosinus propionicus DSM 13327 TaxID=1123291 RepID=A0A1I4K6K4_9FIRM|nr:AzlD domain-containing protein [Pelosinus propionicus]SFL74448.1 Branched-chain amino acid transport protein [Pelosinus propionicus DSM 13327]